MIAAPRLGVVLKHLWREGARNRCPSSAIPAVVADQRIRTGVRVWSLVDFAGEINSRNHLRTVFWIANIQQLLPDLLQQTVSLSAGLDNALAFPSANIQIQSVQTYPVRAR